MKMNKKFVSYLYLTLSVVVMVYSIYYVANYIIDSVANKWNIEEAVQAESASVNKEDQVMKLIRRFEQHPEIREVILSPESTNNNYDTIKSQLGIENFVIQNNVMSTNLGCTILTLEKTSIIGYKWANNIENGSIRFVIKNMKGENVLENKLSNTSIQDETTLPAGDYFVFVEWDVQGKMAYNLFCTEK